VLFASIPSEFFKLNAAHYGSQHNNRFRICYAELTIFKLLFCENRQFDLRKALGEIEKDEIYKNFVCRNLGI
uniref:hypothetical protein n=1 Tax=Leptospira noguchii TaxID=28182 RepID=UPI00077456C3